VGCPHTPAEGGCLLHSCRKNEDEEQEHRRKQILLARFLFISLFVKEKTFFNRLNGYMVRLIVRV
jgi:hypothetical protein